MTTKATALARLGAAVRAKEKSDALTHHALLDAEEAGASLAEIGEKMGIPRKTVWHRIKAARAATGRTKRSEKE